MTPTERAAFLLSLADRIAVAEVTQPEGDRVRVSFTREELQLALDCIEGVETEGLVRALFTRALQQMDAEDN